jgi:hypothetical protein
MNNIALPEIGDKSAFEIYSDNDVTKLSHQDCLEKINKFSLENKINYSNVVNSAPLIYPVNATLGFLGSLSNKSYSIFPGSYNFNNIVKMIEINNAKHLICEESLFGITMSAEKIKQIIHVTEKVEQIYIFCSDNDIEDGDDLGFKEIFPNAEMKFYSDKTFDLI